MTEGFGNMKKLISLSLILSMSVLADDNEIYLEQNGNNSTINIEQIGGY